MAIFYVNQTRTYKDEKEGGFVWSPQLTTNGRKDKGYTTMTHIKKNDLIIHCSSGMLKAISIANSNCYEAYNLKEGKYCIIILKKLGTVKVIE